MSEEDTESSVQDWEKIWRSKAAELASIREQLEGVTSTMSSVENVVLTWKKHFGKKYDNPMEYGPPRPSRLPPLKRGGHLKMKPRQKLLERVKYLDKCSHKGGESGKSELKSKFEGKSSEVNLPPSNHNDGNAHKTGSSDSRMKYHNDENILPQIFSLSSETREPVASMQNDFNEMQTNLRRVHFEDMHAIETKENTVENSEILQHKVCSPTASPKLSDDNDDVSPKTQGTASHTVNTTTSNNRNTIPMSLRASGVNKEFKELFRLLDAQAQKKRQQRKKEEENATQDEVENSGLAHIPKKSSGLYREFNELFRLLDNQKSFGVNTFNAPNIVSDVNEICSVLNTSGLLCQNCRPFQHRTYEMCPENEEQENEKREQDKSHSASCSREKHCSSKTQAQLAASESSTSSYCNEDDNGEISVKVTIKQRPLSDDTFSPTTDPSSTSVSGRVNNSLEDLSLNAKKNVRWSNNLEKHCSALHTDTLEYKLPQIQSKKPNKTTGNSSQEKNSRSLNYHIKDVLLELPPITNDVKGTRGSRRSNPSNDFCGWIDQSSDQDTETDTRDPLYLKAKYGNKSTWNTRLPPLQPFGNRHTCLANESPKSTNKQSNEQNSVENSLAQDNIIGLHGVAMPLDNEKMWYQNESDVSELKEPTVKMNFVELDELPRQDTKKREFSALPPLRGTSVRKSKRESLAEQNDKKNFIKIEVNKLKQTPPISKHRSSPVKEFLKPLPPMKTKTAIPMVNWTKRNVGPIKVPPLDLNLLENSVQVGLEQINFVTDLVNSSPRAAQMSDEICQIGSEYCAPGEDVLPTDKMLKYHFRRRADDIDKKELPVNLLGTKIKLSTDYDMFRKKETDIFSQKNYRLRKESKDVPMELVKIALKSNSVNKGYTDISRVLQESKKCKLIQKNELIPNNNCSVLKANPTRKRSAKRPRLEHFQSEVYKCKKDEEELNALRRRLKECVSVKTNEKRYKWYDRYEEYTDVTDSARSAIARPCSPNSYRTPH